MFEDIRIYPSRMNFSDQDLRFLLELERLLGYALGVRKVRQDGTEPNKRKSNPIWTSIGQNDEEKDKVEKTQDDDDSILVVKDKDYDDKKAGCGIAIDDEPNGICIKSPFGDKYQDDDDEIEENKPTTKEHPFVFICNRLTFLIKTRYPIIWDTSIVVESDEDCVFVALDKSKNPMIDMKEAAKLSTYINSNPEIQKEVKEFLEDTKWSGIVCSPYRMAYNGESRFGFMFTLIEE